MVRFCSACQSATMTQKRQLWINYTTGNQPHTAHDVIKFLQSNTTHSACMLKVANIHLARTHRTSSVPWCLLLMIHIWIIGWLLFLRAAWTVLPWFRWNQWAASPCLPDKRFHAQNTQPLHSVCCSIGWVLGEESVGMRGWNRLSLVPKRKIASQDFVFKCVLICRVILCHCRIGCTQKCFCPSFHIAIVKQTSFFLSGRNVPFTLLSKHTWILVFKILYLLHTRVRDYWVGLWVLYPPKRTAVSTKTHCWQRTLKVYLSKHFHLNRPVGHWAFCDSDILLWNLWNLPGFHSCGTWELSSVLKWARWRHFESRCRKLIWTEQERIFIHIRKP